MRRNERMRLVALAALIVHTAIPASPDTWAPAGEPVTGPPPSQSLVVPADGSGTPGLYIVVLREDPSAGGGSDEDQARGNPASQTLAELAEEYKLAVYRDWTDAFPIFAVESLPSDQAQSIADDPRVLVVEQDSAIPLSNFAPDCLAGTHPTVPDPGFPSSPQTIACVDPSPGGTGCEDNWGLDRIDEGDIDPATRDGFYAFPSTASTVHLYFFDTGLTPGHQEYEGPNGQSRVGEGIYALVGPNDARRFEVTDNLVNSHGTHVTAIAAGKTYGVAKRAIIHPIRANLNDPNGQVQAGIQPVAILEGVHWILTTRPHGQQPAAANLSANGSEFATSEALALAIRRLIQAGVALVESAGNQNMDAAGFTMVGGRYPDEVLVVGGSTVEDERWTHPDPENDPLCNQTNPDQNTCASNFGSALDLFAPAKDVVSASNKGSGTVCLLTGTSMAAPHVTGAAALLLEEYPHAQPSAVAKGLVERAATMDTLDPGTLGKGSPNVLLHTNFPSTGPPVAGSDLFETPAQTPLTIFFSELLEGDFDWSHQSLTVQVPDCEPPLGTGCRAGHGTVTWDSDSVTYTPDPGFTGDDAFQYTVSNGSSQDSATVRINVGDLDLPPVAVDDILTTTVNTPVFFYAFHNVSGTPNLLHNDFDPEPNSSQVRFDQIISDPAHGTIEPPLTPQGAYRYTPDAGYSGPDSFRYRIHDLIEGQGQFAEATVHIDVGAPPVDVRLIAGYAPAPSSPRQEFVSTSPTPSQVISFYHDPTLGTFEQRPGGACQDGSNNPTYVTVRADVSEEVDSCTYQASWDSAPRTCTPAILEGINTGHEFILNTDDFEADIPACREKIPLVPHVRYNVEHWLQVTFTIDQVAYARRVRFRQSSDVRYLSPAGDTYVSQSAPNANFGTASALGLEAQSSGDGKHVFLRFDLNNLPGTVAGARVVVETQAAGITNLTLYRMCSADWTETQLTWNNWEDLTDGSCGHVQTLTNVAPNRGHAFGVGEEVDANGSYAFGIATEDSRNDRRLGSSESVFDTPRLIVTLVR